MRSDGREQHANNAVAAECIKRGWPQVASKQRADVLDALHQGGKLTIKELAVKIGLRTTEGPVTRIRRILEELESKRLVAFYWESLEGHGSSRKVYKLAPGVAPKVTGR